MGARNSQAKRLKLILDKGTDMRVIIKGNWAPYVGTDYCDVLGVYDSLESKACLSDAEDYAWNCWEGADDESFEDEGPDYSVEEYDSEKHYGLKAGGGSFQYQFARIEADERGPTPQI
jgi:hypothetical protein